MRKIVLGIMPLTEAGSYVGYWAKGHHTAAEFIAELERNWQRTTTQEHVEQVYARFVPYGTEGRRQFILSKPGRGAFPATICEYTLPKS